MHVIAPVIPSTKMRCGTPPTAQITSYVTLSPSAAADAERTVPADDFIAISIACGIVTFAAASFCAPSDGSGGSVS